MSSMKHCHLKGDLLTYLAGKYFTVHNMIANYIKLSVLDFFIPKPSLGAHTVHDLSFCLRIP